MQNFKKTLFFSSIFFFVFSLLVFYFLYKETNKNKKVAEDTLIDWQNEKQKRDEIKSLDTLVKSISQDKILIETHFAQSSNIVPFLDTIEGLALRVSVKAKVDSVNISEDGLSLTVDLKAIGNFSAVYRFLTLLENALYELEIISLNIENAISDDLSGKVKKSAEWQADFKIKLLSFIK